jgi:hypothetical protein
MHRVQKAERRVRCRARSVYLSQLRRAVLCLVFGRGDRGLAGSARGAIRLAQEMGAGVNIYQYQSARPGLSRGRLGVDL